MIDFSRNHFDLFGLEPRFRCDAAALERAFRALQGEVHPDRFATAGDAERRLALQSSARVNEAYGVLKDPVERARYLLQLNGVDALAETDTALPLEFLERQLERREQAAEAAGAGDRAALAAIRAGIDAELQTAEARLAALLDDAQAFDEARMRVREFRFLAKVREDVDALIAANED